MTIDFRTSGHVATVTINRPDRRNAIDNAHHDQLVEAWQAIEADPETWVVVLTGAGEQSFCAGADIHESQPDGHDYWGSRDPDGFGGIALRTSMTKPIIARVNGVALGGGFEMVLGCDIAVAAEHTKIGLVEPRIGRLPVDGGIVNAIRHAPRKHAMELLLTGGTFDAQQAFRMGFINEVVPSDQLDAAIDKWVEIVLSCAPSSLVAIKALVNQTQHLSARDANLVDIPEVRASMTSADAIEGPAAFREKRPARWSGA
ncbi:MAG: crotonase [Acidimicrobiia bacterium]|nr:crotonase [Acidimicrobiia bacterium]